MSEDPNNTGQTTDVDPDGQTDLEEGQTTDPVEPNDDDDGQTTEDPEVIEVNGRQMTQSQLIESYKNLEKDYQRKSGELSKITRQEKPRTDEDKKVEDFISQYGIVTAEQMQVIMQDNEELSDLKGSGANAKQISAVKSLARSKGMLSNGTPYTQASMREIYEDLFGDLKKSKVVKTKVVGVKPKSGSKTTGKLTREAIKAMSPEQYTKNKEAIMAAMAKGEIT